MSLITDRIVLFSRVLSLGEGCLDHFLSWMWICLFSWSGWFPPRHRDRHWYDIYFFTFHLLWEFFKGLRGVERLRNVLVCVRDARSETGLLKLDQLIASFGFVDDWHVWAYFIRLSRSVPIRLYSWLSVSIIVSRWVDWVLGVALRTRVSLHGLFMLVKQGNSSNLLFFINIFVDEEGCRLGILGSVHLWTEQVFRLYLVLLVVRRILGLTRFLRGRTF